MSAFHALSFEVHSSWVSVMCKKIISEEKCPWHTSAEFKRKHFQHQGEERWVKDKALINTPTPMPISSLYWPFIHTHYRHWSTCPGRRAYLIHQHRGYSRPTTWSSWHTIEDFLKVDEGKVHWFVSGDVLLLQMFFCRCRTMKMISKVPLPGTKPNCILSMFTI